MSDFKMALSIVLSHEGGYANDPSDRGGMTYRGISQKNWPDWRGWRIINENKPLKYNQIINDKYLNDLVEVFYYEHFWKPIQGEKIKDQRIANFLFDWYVNSGYHAIKALQRLVNAVPDGIIGPKTIAAINASNGDLIDTYKEARIIFYKKIVTNRPDQGKFLSGWLKRVESFT